MSIPFINRWLKRRSERARKANYGRGYDFAAGMCLRGCDREEIRSLQDWQPNEFDAGMNAAMKDFSNLLKRIKS